MSWSLSESWATMVSARRAGSSMVGHRHDHLGRDALVELDVGLEGRVDRAHQRLDLDGRVVDVLDLLDVDLEIGVGLDELADPARASPLDVDLDRPVGQAEQLADRPQGPDREDVVGGGLVGLGLLLRRQQDFPAVGHGLVQGPDRLLSPHEQRDHHVGEDDDVPKWEERHLSHQPQLTPARFDRKLPYRRNHTVMRRGPSQRGSSARAAAAMRRPISASSARGRRRSGPTARSQKKVRQPNGRAA